jgi:TRAP-type C4-dicarboxylate transport system permease small subunit
VSDQASGSEAKGRLARLDHGIFRVERALAWSIFIGMALLMFVSVTHEVFNRGEGRFSLLFLNLFGDPADEASKAFFHGPFSIAFNLIGTFLLALLAVRTRKQERKPSWGLSLALAVGVTLVLAGFVKLLLTALPNGIFWAPYMALVGTVWVGLLGASMATYQKRHLAMEMGEKIWPRKLVPYVRSLASVVAAGGCFFLFYLSYVSAAEHHASWSNNPLVDVVVNTKVPIWLVMSVFLWAFGMMTARFLGQAVRAITHPDEGGGEVLPGLPVVHDPETETAEAETGTGPRAGKED